MTKSQNRGLVPTIQAEPDFSKICWFCEVLDNVELITYMKFCTLQIIFFSIWGSVSMIANNVL